MSEPSEASVQEFSQDTISEPAGPVETAMDNLRICLFCNHKSDGIKKNLDHMRVKHSFYVLDIDCLISLKALLYYLAEKIQAGHMCVMCHKKFPAGFSA
jgi:hypothetical protein